MVSLFQSSSLISILSLDFRVGLVTFCLQELSAKDLENIQWNQSEIKNIITGH